MHGDETRSEARRVLGICNACGYCNGFCDLFEAARRRPALADADLAHLANLCHACRNCLYACQYAPPHLFAVNVPRSLELARRQSYLDHVWPRSLAGLLAHSGLAVSLVCLGAIALVLGTVLIRVPPEVLFATHQGPGAFYRVIPLGWMLLIGLLPLGWSALAMGIGLRRYWRATRTKTGRVSAHVLWSAVRDVLVLRNLRGGGPGCNDLDDRPSQGRRRLHQTMLFGVLLSFAATLTAAVYHHALGLQAPYPLLSVPVLLGTAGGVAMSIAAPGLAWLKWRGDRTPTAPEAHPADYALLALLLLVATTGLGLLGWRETPAMGVLLAIHLGSVLAFFWLIPYSKLVHAGYRFVALLIEAIEREGFR
jgi:citrate/tricarballylate utilization protein